MLKTDTAAISLCPWREQILWLQLSSFPSRELLCFHLLQRAAKQCPLKADPFQPFATKMFTFFSLNLSFGSILRTSLSSVSCSSSFHALSTQRLRSRVESSGRVFLVVDISSCCACRKSSERYDWCGSQLGCATLKKLEVNYILPLVMNLKSYVGFSLFILVEASSTLADNPKNFISPARRGRRPECTRNGEDIPPRLNDGEPFVCFTINGSFILLNAPSKRHVLSTLIRLHYSNGAAHMYEHVRRKCFSIGLQSSAPGGKCLIIQLYSLDECSRRREGNLINLFKYSSLIFHVTDGFKVHIFMNSPRQSWGKAFRISGERAVVDDHSPSTRFVKLNVLIMTLSASTHLIFLLVIY